MSSFAASSGSFWKRPTNDRGRSAKRAIGPEAFLTRFEKTTRFANGADNGGDASRGDVLIYGRDPDLLRTRALVLNSAGYLIWAATEIAALEKVLVSEPVGLCILCHSLQEEDYLRAVAVVERFRPEIHVLSLKGSVSLPVSKMNVRIFNDFVNPVTLLQIVSESLQDSQPF